VEVDVDLFYQSPPKEFSLRDTGKSERGNPLPWQRLVKTNFITLKPRRYIMASNNSLTTGKLSGTLGKELVFRDWDGKTVVAKAPKKRKGDPTSQQAETQEKFLIASRYARSVIKRENKDLANAYAAVLRPRQNVYSRALEDFMSPPVVKSINTRTYKGAAGDLIVINALDDFRVASVRVEIYAANGTLLEEGNAEPSPDDIYWTYKATQANSPLAGSKIIAIATDVPRNEGTLEVTL
jgi:hypothetical protein